MSSGLSSIFPLECHIELTVALGPGGNTSARVAPSHVLKDEANFTFEEVFNGRPEWIDYTYVAGS